MVSVPSRSSFCDHVSPGLILAGSVIPLCSFVSRLTCTFCACTVPELPLGGLNAMRFPFSHVHLPWRVTPTPKTSCSVKLSVSTERTVCLYVSDVGPVIL